MAGVWDELELKIRAGYPFLYLLTHEESRVEAHLGVVARRMGQQIYSYSDYQGFKPQIPMAGEDAVETIAAARGGGIFILNDFHEQLSEPRRIRQVKDLRNRLMNDKKTLIVTAPILRLPPELEKQFAIVDVPLPEVKELKTIFLELCRQRNFAIDKRLAEVFARAASGLTAEEAMLVFSRLHLEPGRIEAGDSSPVIEEKRRLIEGEGVLTFYDRHVTLRDVGGLEALKHWLIERESAFEERAREFGLPEPKGLLLLGVQGCGKSLSAKAVASHWRLPLVQLELSAAFSSRQSPEEAIRRALKLLEALSPVVVWIDEIEKGFAGTAEGGSEMATQRVFGHFITWLQEKRKPVFVVATANRVTELPPELLRKGRFDELFFVDLPDENERKEIFEVHLAARNIDKSSVSIDPLLDLTRNYTGAEIEQIVIDALYRAFAKERPLRQEDLETVAAQIIPIYNTYEEEIKSLRDWCRERTRKASVDTSLTDYFEQGDS